MAERTERTFFGKYWTNKDVVFGLHTVRHGPSSKSSLKNLCRCFQSMPKDLTAGELPIF